MSSHQDVFKKVMRRWASGVSIVTTRVGGQVYGLTVSGFAGISLDPPLVMVSVGHNQASHDRLRDGACFGVNLLRADQADLSNRFAGLQEGVADRFEGIAYHLETSGAPIFDDCLAWFDCRLDAMHAVGDHTLFIGAVLAGEVVSAAPPLIFYNGDYPPLRLEDATDSVAERN